ncbi:MAG: aldo/keto reductase [Anaerolineales bacterium]
MKTCQIPRTDLSVSRIAYGCMNLGGTWDQSPPDAAVRANAARVVLTAFEQGITLFDHADIYTRGKSETVFGEILKHNPGLREKIVVQSKCGIRFEDQPRDGDPGRYDFSYEHILRCVEGSLGRLNAGWLDVLLLHRPDPLAEPGEVARAFDELQRRGWVRFFGVSNHTPAQIELLRTRVDQPLVVNQIEVNLLHSHVINEGIIANQDGGAYAAAAGTLDYCRSQGILVQAWSPVAAGRLIAPSDSEDERVQRTASAVRKMASEKETAPEAIALSWLLRHPAPIQPIIGTTNPDRVIASCLADGVELSREEWYSLFVAARGAPVP